MEIDELVGVWPTILHRQKTGELRKSDVVAALRSGEAIPPALVGRVMPLLADIVEGKPMFKTGQKSRSEFVKLLSVLNYEWLKKELEAGDVSGFYDEGDQKAARRNLANGQTPHNIAVDAVAAWFGIQDTQLREYRKKYGRE